MGVALLAAPAPAMARAVREGAARLRAARPTAVNLAWGVDRALARLDDGPDAVLAEALRGPRRGHRGVRGHRRCAART